MGMKVVFQNSTYLLAVVIIFLQIWREIGLSILNYIFFGIIVLVSSNMLDLSCRSSITFLCCIIGTALVEYITYLTNQESELDSVKIFV